MSFSQHDITLEARPRGVHLVTSEIVGKLPQLRDLRVGLAHIFIRHTSASLTLNENASSDVRRDFETWLNAYVPEDFAWTHTLEGPDDMPAHIKAALMGLVADAADRRRPARARDVAGDLPLRAPRPRRPALAARHAQRRVAAPTAGSKRSTSERFEPLSCA